jgi:hypothetical protein
MSRGAGRVERAIRELFDASPDLAFVTVELVEHCFPRVEQAAIERKHEVSVLRAAHKIVAAHPDWMAWRIEGQGRGWVFFNHANVQSYALARLIADVGFTCYRSSKRARRISGQYLRPDGRRLTEEQLARERRRIKCFPADHVRRQRNAYGAGQGTGGARRAASRSRHAE